MAIKFFLKTGAKAFFKGLEIPFNEMNLEIVSEFATNDSLMKRRFFKAAKDMVIFAIKQLEKDIEGF